MNNTSLLCIVCQILKWLLIKLFNIQPPNSLNSYLLFYIFLFNGFTQGDQVVSCAKKNLHHHHPLYLQNWTALNIYFKRSMRLPFFCSGTTKSSIPQAQVKLFTSMKVSIPSTSLFRSFPWLWLLMLLVVF